MIINGKEIAQKGYEELKSAIEKETQKPVLSAILVGDNPASLRYIKQKAKWAEYTGIEFDLIHLEENISEEEILKIIENLNLNKKVNGFMVQLPLPFDIDTKKIIESISPKKDVDGFHPVNQGKLMIGEENGFAPCTPEGIMHIFSELQIDLKGKNIVVIGKSNIVGKPVTNMCINAGATVTSCNSKTKDITFFTKNADIVICAAGKPGLLTLDMIQNHTVVIDVGFTIIDGKIHGDTDFEAIEQNGNMITPVPGGVGSLTVLHLMKNTYKAFLQQIHHE